MSHMLQILISEGQGRLKTGVRESASMLSIESFTPLIVFAALLLVLSLHGLAASGQFPREHRKPALATTLGAALLYGSIALAVVSVGVALLGAWRLIPWYAAVIGGCLAI